VAWQAQIRAAKPLLPLRAPNTKRAVGLDWTRVGSACSTAHHPKQFARQAQHPARPTAIVDRRRLLKLSRACASPAKVIKDGSFERVNLTLLSVDEQKLPVGLRMRRMSPV
jgi:hypothetical protein